MSGIEPGDEARPPFRISLRGYDRGDVDAHLRSLAAEIEGLREDRDRLAARLHAGADRDLATEFDAISREVGEVLEAARVAAEGMRERAAAETARWRSETLAELEAESKQARQDAEHLRGDAWTTAEELLRQSQREAARIVEEAKEESLRLIGEAERQAHRIEGGARRDSEEALRTARMEAERLVLDAQNRHDEIIETANRQAEIASERTRALELRRDELRKELDAVRAALSAVEGELDERRAMLGISQPEDVATEAGTPEVWTPGETVRVVRPQAPEEPPAEAPPAERRAPEEVARLGEVRVISASELAKVGEGPEPDEEEEPERPSAPLEAEEILGAEQEAQTPDRELEEGEPPAEPAGGSKGSEAVTGLFARLRTPAAEAEPEQVPSPAVEEPEAPAERPEPSPPPRDDSSRQAPAAPTPDVATLDAFDLRDRLLLPVANEALRAIKRELTEEQNIALEHLRVEETAWIPDTREFAHRVREHFTALTGRSRAAGWAAVSEMTGVEMEAPEAPGEDPTDELAAELARDLEHVLSEGLAHDEGSREVAASVSRVFRAWRTDESERRVRDLAHAAFHGGLAEAAHAAGFRTRWVVSGRGCATCREHAEEEPDGVIPPAHPGCGCTLVVA